MRESEIEKIITQTEHAKRGKWRARDGLYSRLRFVAELLKEAPPGGYSRGQLLWRNDRNEVVAFAITASIVLGRDGFCDLSVANFRVSRRHCTVLHRRAGDWIKDLASTNGTLVNGEAVIRPRLLHDGDIIQLGGIPFVYVRRS